MEINTDLKKIEELLTRAVGEVIHQDDLKKKLLSGKQLRVKFGVDPTSPNIHIGRSVPLLKLKDFQDLGHQVVLIVGDFTGVIGDTSDKESERPMLSRENIEENKKTYFDQVGKILDLEKTELSYNSEWLEKLTYREIGEHADRFSVSDFIARENIKKRLDAGKRVSLREVLYPLMQGYDSVAVKSDVEVGGTDQRFNMLAGRTLQPHFEQEAQNIIMTELINGTDGRKMSSSWGNTINLLSSASEMYGKVMSVNDSEMVTYFKMCTRVPLDKILLIEKDFEEEGSPRDIKMKLAWEITNMYHGVGKADKAEQVFVETFQQKQIPEDVIEIKPEYSEALIAAGLVESKSALRRLLDAGGVKNADSGEKINQIPDIVEAPITLKIGKRRFVKLLP